MAESPKDEPITDEDLEDAAGGQTPIHPGGAASTGPENIVGQTSC